jgi:DNA-binding winged helix-turn-helix (wHTH) protein
MARGSPEVLKMIGRNPEFLRFGQFRFTPGDGLWRDGQPVPLPPRAIGVLTALLTTPGCVVSKQQLMDAVWPGTFVTESSLLEAIGLVREALGDDRRNPAYIQTVHRRGYRFIGRIETPIASAEFPPFFSGPEWRPIVLACATYAMTTVCVAIVFALLGRRPIDSASARQDFSELRRDSAGAAFSREGERRADASSVPAARLAVSDDWPSWTLEGIEIAFAVSKAGPFHSAGAWHRFPTSVSPDGQLIVFADTHPMSGADIWVLDQRTATRRALVRTWSDETFARFSPDGRSIAYMSNISGRWEVYVQSLSGGSPVRVSANGGAWPSWSTDGVTVYYSARPHGPAELRVVLDWFSELASRAATHAPLPRVGPGVPLS